MKDTENGSADEGLLVRIRGLPYSCTKGEVVEFFEGCSIKGGEEGVFLSMNHEGRPSGEGFVEFESDSDFEKAKSFHKRNLGSRYIEVFASKKSELDYHKNRMNGGGGSEFPGFDDDADVGMTVRLRGLPFGSTKEDIQTFFEGLEISNNGILITTDHMGRASGEAFVKFTSQEGVDAALAKHKDKIGHRYIEIFVARSHEIRASTYGGGGGGGGGFRGRGGYGDSYDGGFRPMRPYMPAGRPTPYERFGGRGQMGGGYGSYGMRYQGGAGPRYRGGYGGGGGGYDEMDNGYGRMSSLRNPHMSPFDSSMNQISPNGHLVRMRGLPFRCSENDISAFFDGINIVSIRISHDTNCADVEFPTHGDAVKAMSRDKHNMQHRYIELFLNSNESSGMGPSPHRPSLPPSQPPMHSSSPVYGMPQANVHHMPALGRSRLYPM